MTDSMALDVAEIYEALGEPERAELLRWSAGASTDRLRDRLAELGDELEAEQERVSSVEDERDELKAELANERDRVKAILDPIPALVDGVNAAIDALIHAYDDAIREVKAALK